jgi:hopanoid biosynthesis associated RND transporter like protein HpnN
MKIFLTRVVEGLYRAILSHPKTVLVLAGIITIAAGLVLPKVNITTDRASMVKGDSPYMRRYSEVSSLFGNPLTGVVVLSGNDREKLHAAADEMVATYRQSTHVRDVFHRVDLSFFETHGILYLPTKNVQLLGRLMEQIELDRLSGARNMGEVIARLTSYLRDVFNAKIDLGKRTRDDNSAILLRAVEEFKRYSQMNLKKELANLIEVKERFSPYQLVPKNYGLDDKGYIASNDDRLPHLLYLMVQPASQSTDERDVNKFTHYLRDTGRRLGKKHGVSMALTGMPAIITDEMTAVHLDVKDMVVSSVICILVLFLIAFRSLRGTILVFLPLVVALVWTVAFGVLWYHKLTLISAYFAAVLFGLGIAYDIHILARFDELRSAGTSAYDSALGALRGAAPGVFTGATTTSAAFFAIGLSEFFGFAQLGVLAGTGVLLMMVTALALLPVMLMLWRGPRAPRPLGGAAMESLYKVVIRPAAIWVVIVAVLFAAFGGWAVTRIKFNFDSYSLLPQSAESIVNYKKVLKRSKFSAELNITTASSLEEAEVKRKAFAKLPTVQRVDSISVYVPADQELKLKALRKVWQKHGATLKALLSHYEALNRNPTPMTTKDLADTFAAVAEVIEDGWYAAKTAGRKEAVALKAMSEEVDHFSKQALKQLDPAFVTVFQKHFLEVFTQGLRLLHANLQTAIIDVDGLPESVRNRFVAKVKGKHVFALYIYPKGNVGDRQFLKQFVKECRTVDPSVTGFPVTHFENGTIIQRSFVVSSILAGILVFILVFVDFRSITRTLVALIPLVIGTAWMIAMMYLLHIDFNFVNVVVLAMIIGAGVDFGVHLMHRYVQEGNVSRSMRQTGGPVFLAALTTLVGFGSMVFARHTGAASLGLLLTIGIVACILSAIVVFPAALSLYQRGKGLESSTTIPAAKP